ncbi:MAG: serine protease [Minicystis sp.]
MVSGRSSARAGSRPAPYSSGEPRARELREILARIYFQQRLVIDVLHRAGLSPGDYDLEGPSWLAWGGVLVTAYNRMELDALLDTVEQDPAAKRWCDRIRELRGPSPVVEAGSEGDAPMEPPGEREDELVMGEQSTLLDVAFLARGLERAPSIVRITAGWGRATAHGTGFLIDGGRILTNHHVIFDAQGEAADRVEAWFNFERGPDGVPARVEARACRPGTIVGEKAQDWAVIDLADAPGAAYRPLSLARPSIPVTEGDRVYIIQHPLGGYKQVGLHHNVVTRVTADRIQYLTDTDKGSSGAPVFNERWEVIALHHCSAPIERSQENPRFGLDDRGRGDPGRGVNIDYRNQGVRIERVIEGLARGRIEG